MMLSAADFEELFPESEAENTVCISERGYAGDTRINVGNPVRDAVLVAMIPGAMTLGATWSMMNAYNEGKRHR